MVEQYQATHTVPATGLQAWPVPDGTGPPAATLDPGLDIQVTERRADWARIRCSNGWEAWIDGRNLVVVAVAVAAPTPPAPEVAEVPPPPHADAPPPPHVDSPPVPADPAPQGQTPAAGSDPSGPSPSATASPAPASPATAPETATAPAEAWTSPAPPRPSPEQAAWAAAGVETAPPRRSFGVAHVIALIGAAIVIASGFLPWLDLAGETVTAYDSPANFLFDSASNDDGVNLGIILLALGAIGVVSVFIRPVRWFTIIIGVVAIVIGLRYIWQTNDLLDLTNTPGNDIGLFDFLSYGAYFAIGGGVIAIVGGVLTLRKPA